MYCIICIYIFDTWILPRVMSCVCVQQSAISELTSLLVLRCSGAVSPSKKRRRGGGEDQRGCARPRESASLGPLLVELGALRFEGNARSSISMAPRRDLDIWCDDKVSDEANQQSQGTTRPAGARWGDGRRVCAVRREP